MSHNEILARLSTSGANAAIIVSMMKGNPSDLTFYAPDGGIILRIHMESAALRREVCTTITSRMTELHSIVIDSNASEKTIILADILARLSDKRLITSESGPIIASKKSGGVLVWFQDLDSEKTLWTHFHADDGREIGPRIRVTSIEPVANL